MSFGRVCGTLVYHSFVILSKKYDWFYKYLYHCMQISCVGSLMVHFFNWTVGLIERRRDLLSLNENCLCMKFVKSKIISLSLSPSLSFSLSLSLTHTNTQTGGSPHGIMSKVLNWGLKASKQVQTPVSTIIVIFRRILLGKV